MTPKRKSALADRARDDEDGQAARVVRLPGVVAIVAMLATVASAQEAIPVGTVAAIKDATVYIRTTSPLDPAESAMSGSGFLIRADGTTGYVVTNHHVITPDDEDKNQRGPVRIQAFFRSGTKAQVEATAEVLISDAERDLAVLRVVNVPNLPKPIQLNAEAQPFETMTVYIFGFPFGEALAFGAETPPVNVGRGQVSSVRRGRDDQLKAILVDGALNPGNSGGPVVDSKGKLVGISVATIRGANIGFAIAVAELLQSLAGEVERVALSSVEAGGKSPALACDVRLRDPLARIKSARLLYSWGAGRFTQTEKPRQDDAPGDNRAGEAQKRKPPDAPNVLYGPIEGAQSVPLTIAGQHAAGAVPRPSAFGQGSLWCQVAYVDGSGKDVYSRPTRYLVAAENSVPQGGVTGSDLKIWGEVVDPDGDCDLKTEAGLLVANVPGTLHDLNIDIGKNNAPRVVHEVNGDFELKVKVLGTFAPGPVPTGPKSVPYNGGGLVVWCDENNYIRLERASMYRNNRVLGLLAFESRENGTRAQRHNKGGLDPKGDLWLRITRERNVFSGSYSEDGQHWKQLEPMEISWPERLQAGLDVVNSCGDPMTVRFQSYSFSNRAR